MDYRTGGQTWYNYFLPPTSIVDLAHHEIYRAKVGKGGIRNGRVLISKTNTDFYRADLSSCQSVIIWSQV